MPVAVTRPRRKLVVVTGAPSLLPRPDIPPQVQLLRGAGLSPGGLGHNRDGRTGTLQIMVGLLCAAKGCPLGAEVYPGETGDPMASAPQIFRVRERWGLERAVWVGDRGLLSEAGIHEELPSVEGLE